MVRKVCVSMHTYTQARTLLSMAVQSVIPGLLQSIHRHPARSSYNFKPAQIQDFEPEVTRQTTWNSLLATTQYQH